MNIVFLVEDYSGKEMLNEIIPKIVNTQNNTYQIFSYKGCGKLPNDLKGHIDPNKRILLDRLPKVLSGYGRQYLYNENENVVVVVLDLDKRDKNVFLGELQQMCHLITTRPQVCFCLAIEECEAWLLGDKNAVLSAYPQAKQSVLDLYVNDSICDTWELLADAIYPGGSEKLKRLSYHEIGRQKSEWAKKIAQHMVIDENQSPSFNFFLGTVQNFCS